MSDEGTIAKWLARIACFFLGHWWTVVEQPPLRWWDDRNISVEQIMLATKFGCVRCGERQSVRDKS